MIRCNLFRLYNNNVIHQHSRPIVTSQCVLIKVQYPKPQKPSLPNLETTPTAKGQIKRKFFQRFFDYLSGYDKVLKKILPGPAVRAIELFTKGTKLLFADMKEFAWTNHVLTSTTNWEKACKTLSRKQLELYLHLPPDLIRTAPVLLVSALPFAQNVVFPIALMFPKWLLSSHFWTDEQWYEVQVRNQQKRQSYYNATLTQMLKLSQNIQTGQTVTNDANVENGVNVDTVADEPNVDLIFNKIKAGLRPSNEDIIALKSVFETGPLTLKNISLSHARHLIKLHDISGISWWWFPRYKLNLHGNILRQIDLAVDREGIDSLTTKELAVSCFLRGLNCKDMEEAEARLYVQNWIYISKNLTSKSASLLLHMPFILGIGHTGQFWNLKQA